MRAWPRRFERVELELPEGATRGRCVGGGRLAATMRKSVGLCGLRRSASTLRDGAARRRPGRIAAAAAGGPEGGAAPRVEASAEETPARSPELRRREPLRDRAQRSAPRCLSLSFGRLRPNCLARCLASSSSCSGKYSPSQRASASPSNHSVRFLISVRADAADALRWRCSPSARGGTGRRPTACPAAAAPAACSCRAAAGRRWSSRAGCPGRSAACRGCRSRR